MQLLQADQDAGEECLPLKAVRVGRMHQGLRAGKGNGRTDRRHHQMAVGTTALDPVQQPCIAALGAGAGLRTGLAPFQTDPAGIEEKAQHQQHLGEGFATDLQQVGDAAGPCLPDGRSDRSVDLRRPFHQAEAGGEAEGGRLRRDAADGKRIERHHMHPAQDDVQVLGGGRLQALHEEITAKRFVRGQIQQGLAMHGIGFYLDDRLQRRGQQLFERLRQRRRAQMPQLVAGATRVHVGHIGRRPALVGILPAEVVGAFGVDRAELRLQGGQAVAQGRGRHVTAQQPPQPIGGPSEGDGWITRIAALQLQPGELLESGAAQPARKGVVGAVEDTSRRQGRRRHRQQGLLHRLHHPGGDPMGRHIGKAPAGNKGGGILLQAQEIRLQEVHVVQTEILRQATGMGHVIGLEVHAHKGALGIGGRQQTQSEPHATAQLQISEGIPLLAAGRGVPLQQGRQVDPVGGELAEEAAAVGAAGVITVVPAHGVS